MEKEKYFARKSAISGNWYVVKSETITTHVIKCKDEDSAKRIAAALNEDIA